MINKLHIKNFKSLLDNDFELKNLNILSGINGSGKSTLCQALLLLKEYFDHYIYSSKTVSLNSDSFNLGTVQDVLNGGAQEDLIDFYYKIIDTEYNFKIDASTDVRKNNFANIVSEVLEHELQSIFFSKIKYLAAERLGPRVVQSKNDYSLRVTLTPNMIHA